MTRRKKSKGSKLPLIRLVGLEAAVAVTGIAGSLTAAAAPGDLDPSFGDVGRQTGIEIPSFCPILSVEMQDDDSVLFGGGCESTYWGSPYEDYFVGRLLPDGTPDAGFAAAALQNTAVYDTALQSDGKAIGVGIAKQPDGRKKLLVFRLRPDGALDPDFGLGGLVMIGDDSANRTAGYSVVVDPDGHIVVAGEHDASLLVARLLANGTLDAAFSSGGTYLGPRTNGSSVRIARAPAGGYRVIADFLADGSSRNCGVIGLTATGAPDPAFGNAGFATPQGLNSGSLSCSSLAIQTDGRVLVGGVDGVAGGYVGRLLSNGAVDSGFNADVVPGRFKSVTAMAVGAAGSIFVSGSDRAGFSGALVVRLLVDGTLDTLFGRDGATTVDLKTRSATFPSINEMKVLPDEGLIVGGDSYGSGGGAFVARLLGNNGGGSPGVLSMKQERFVGTEQSGKAMLSVRRSGGSAGAVAVTYSIRDFPADYAPGARATAGTDYTATTGRLTWADGDLGEREIEVPLASDTAEEPPEWFEVVLETPEGGAGLGAFGADVEIAGASYPAGDLTIYTDPLSVTEGREALVWVNRNFYGQGAVSVTVRVMASGSATPGQDFSNIGSTDWQDVVLTWADGETGAKDLRVLIARDATSEQVESFALELVSPTGGAVLGGSTQATVRIKDQPSAANGRGGGSFGWLGAMLLGLGGQLRRRLIRNR